MMRKKRTRSKRFQLIKPSTQAFFREGRHLEHFTFWDQIHGYVYARWPYLYIGIGSGKHPIAQKIKQFFRFWDKKLPTGKLPSHSLHQATGTVADHYHGKAIPLSTAKELVSVNEEIYVEDLEQVIPYIEARAIILRNPSHIVALECPCRSSKENPCLPLDVCLIVGEPFASFVIEHHPQKARWVTQQEAVDILEAENQRGHVHHAFFKDAMLGRFYAICNCCSCCCGAFKLHNLGKPMLCSSGYSSKIDEQLCIGCGICQSVCQFNAIKPTEQKKYIIDWQTCMGCGVCVSHCPNNAISFNLDSQKGVPLEITQLIQHN